MSGMGKHGPECCKETTTHRGCTAESCVRCSVCRDHMTFKNAAARRKASGIKLKRWQILLDSNQIESINVFWDSWVRALGKQKAGDYLIVVMRKADETLHRVMEERQSGKKNVRQDPSSRLAHGVDSAKGHRPVQSKTRS